MVVMIQVVLVVMTPALMPVVISVLKAIMTSVKMAVMISVIAKVMRETTAKGGIYYLPLSLIIYNIYINRLLLPNSERTPYLLHLLERLPLPNSTRTPYLSIQRRDSPLVELKMGSGPL